MKIVIDDPETMGKIIWELPAAPVECLPKFAQEIANDPATAKRLRDFCSTIFAAHMVGGITKDTAAYKFLDQSLNAMKEGVGNILLQRLGKKP